MKILILSGVFLLLCAYSRAQEKAAIQGQPQDIVYDFGIITKDKAVSKIFKIYNNTQQAVRIRSIWSSPYCNVTAWSKKPIKAGKHGLMKVAYNGARTGPFKATLKVYYYDSGRLDTERLIEDILIQGEIRENGQED